MATPTPPDTPAPVKLHCADALTAEMTPAEQMERAKVVMQASQRMPAVGFFGARYGERWHVDIVALPHNAVRRQLYDAFVMATALGKMTLDVPEADLLRVYAWLGSLERFVEATLDAEHRFLYPVVDALARKKREKLPEMLTPAGRASAREQILELLGNARMTRDVSLSETGAKINALRYALDQFGANILDYYGAMEKFLPKFFKNHLARKGERTKAKVERATVAAMRERPQGSQLVALLMQCIESRTRRAQFLANHFKKERARDAFKADVRQIQATHMQLARVFDATATRYERIFSVNTFLTHYGANVNGEETLNLLGDLDLNEEGDFTVAAPADIPTEMRPASDPALNDDINEDYIIVKSADDPQPPAQQPAQQPAQIEPAPGSAPAPPFPEMPEVLGHHEPGPDSPSGLPESFDDGDEAYIEVEDTYEAEYVPVQSPKI